MRTLNALKIQNDNVKYRQMSAGEVDETGLPRSASDDYPVYCLFSSTGLMSVSLQGDRIEWNFFLVPNQSIVVYTENCVSVNYRNIGSSSAYFIVAALDDV